MKKIEMLFRIEVPGIFTAEQSKSLEDAIYKKAKEIDFELYEAEQFRYILSEGKRVVELKYHFYVPKDYFKTDMFNLDRVVQAVIEEDFDYLIMEWDSDEEEIREIV